MSSLTDKPHWKIEDINLFTQIGLESLQSPLQSFQMRFSLYNDKDLYLISQHVR